MPTENLDENLHQRPHLEQFWEPGSQEHIFDKSGWVGNFAKELQTQKKCDFLECFVIRSMFCNYNMHSSIYNASPDV